MYQHPGTIVDTYLDYWSEKVLVAFLLIDFGGVIRAVGGDLLHSGDAALNERYGEEYALRIMAACGVDRWEDLDGRKLNVLLDAPFPWGRAIGIAGEGERGGPFIFADLQAEYGVAHSGTSAPGYTRPHPLH